MAPTICTFSDKKIEKIQQKFKKTTAKGLDMDWKYNLKREHKKFCLKRKEVVIIF